jgi:hypothetical protein
VGYSEGYTGPVVGGGVYVGGEVGVVVDGGIYVGGEVGVVVDGGIYMGGGVDAGTLAVAEDGCSEIIIIITIISSTKTTATMMPTFAPVLRGIVKYIDDKK